MDVGEKGTQFLNPGMQKKKPFVTSVEAWKQVETYSVGVIKRGCAGGRSGVVLCRRAE
jgi:hypothetical protein